MQGFGPCSLVGCCSLQHRGCDSRACEAACHYGQLGGRAQRQLRQPSIPSHALSAPSHAPSAPFPCALLCVAVADCVLQPPCAQALAGRRHGQPGGPHGQLPQLHHRGAAAALGLGECWLAPAASQARGLASHVLRRIQYNKLPIFSLPMPLPSLYLTHVQDVVFFPPCPCICPTLYSTSHTVVQRNMSGVYTFGAPAVGNASFAACECGQGLPI